MKSSHQLHATLILSKYSLLAMLRSPTSVVFSLLFPIIFIVVFGSMVGDRIPPMKLAIAPGCDTTGPIFKTIEKMNSVVLERDLSPDKQADALQKGRITAILNILEDGGIPPSPHYLIQLRSGSASAETRALLKTIFGETVRQINEAIHPRYPDVVSLNIIREPGRIYRQIDFILPGQLGFSLLMAGVFGSSFLLFSLRQSLVLKRLRVTPINKRSIIAGEMLSRLFFHVIGFIIMVALGYYAFQFTLVNGFYTFLEMLLFSLFGLGIFMGTGFIISGVLQNESSISPVANTITLPQILLCGLFFPIESYPHWLQGFCNLLPLTFFVDGLRKIAFEGVHIWEMPKELLGLVIWTVIIGFWSIRSFKWE